MNISPFSLCLAFALSLPCNAWADAPHHKAVEPIIDAQVRSGVIVDFTDELPQAFNPVPPAFNFTQPEPRIFGTGPTEPGSNYGNCVDIWAPGDYIYSTWGSGLNSTYSTASYFGGQPGSYVPGTVPGSPSDPNPATLYQGLFGWQWLSGTSMAAPHVAAAAAYLADKYYLLTPIDIEQKIRDNWQTWTAEDPTSTSQIPVPMRIVYLPD